jgi:hypothetical protein
MMRRIYSIKRKKSQPPNLFVSMGTNSVIPEESENFTEGDTSPVTSKSNRPFRDMVLENLSPTRTSFNCKTPRSPSVKFSFKNPLENLQAIIADLVSKMTVTGNYLWSNERLISELESKSTMISETLEIFRTRVNELEKGISDIVKKQAQYSKESILDVLGQLLNNTDYKYEIQEISKLSENSHTSRRNISEATGVKLHRLAKSNSSHSNAVNKPDHKKLFRHNTRGSVAIEPPSSDIFAMMPTVRQIKSSKISPDSSQHSKLKESQVVRKFVLSDEKEPIESAHRSHSRVLNSQHDFLQKFNFVDPQQSNGLPLLNSLENDLSPVLPGIDLPVVIMDSEEFDAARDLHGVDADQENIDLPVNLIKAPQLSRKSSLRSHAAQEPRNMELHEPEPERLANLPTDLQTNNNTPGTRRKTLIRVLGLKQDHPLAEPTAAARPYIASGLATAQQSTHTLEMKGFIESKHRDGALVINLRNRNASGMNHQTTSNRMALNGHQAGQRLEGFMKQQAEKSPETKDKRNIISPDPKARAGFADYLFPRPLVNVSPRPVNSNLHVSTKNIKIEAEQLLSTSRSQLNKPFEPSSKPQRTGLQNLLTSMKGATSTLAVAIHKKKFESSSHLLAIPPPQSSSRNFDLSIPTVPNTGSNTKIHTRTSSVKPGIFSRPEKFKGWKDAADI